MSITIGSNIAALRALQGLTKATNEISKVSERLSSGMRINHASDDAAGISLATKLSAETAVYNRGIKNLNDGISLLNVADGALSELSKIITRVMELSEQAANGVYQSKQREALDREAQALILEYQRIVDTTTFNGISVLPRTQADIRLQSGYGVNDAISLSLKAPGMDVASETVTGDGTFTAVGSVAHVGSLAGFTYADLNEDGKMDLIGVNLGGGGGHYPLSLFFGHGDGTFDAPVSLSFNFSNANNPAILDINKDGNLDIVTADANADSYSVRLGNGDGTFGGLSVSAAGFGGAVGIPLLGDFNNDSHIDLIVTASGGGNTRLFLGDSTGAFGAGTTLSRPAYAALDLNGDNNLDLIGPNASVSLGNGSGGFGAVNTYYVNAEQGVSLLDFDSDGDVDYASYAPGAGNTIILQNDGNGVLSLFSIFGGGPLGGTLSGSQDLNDDGNADLIVSTGSDVYLYYGNGDLTFQSGVDSGLSGTRASTVDLNNDGLEDLVTMEVDTVHLGIATANGTTESVLGFPEISLTSQSAARDALTTSRNILDLIAEQQGKIGASLSRVSIASSALSSRVTALQESYSRITNADIAQEGANLVRARILRETSAAILAQANQQPSLVLKLLEGI